MAPYGLCHSYFEGTRRITELFSTNIVLVFNHVLAQNIDYKGPITGDKILLFRKLVEDAIPLAIRFINTVM